PTCSLNGSVITHRKILSYDQMGRVLSENQLTPASTASGQTYAPGYSYHLDGSLSTWTDGITPSPTAQSAKLQFTNVIGGAGRVTSTASNWTDSTHPLTLFSAAVPPSPCASATSGQYAAFGGLTNAAFGAGLTLSRTYDPRMRLSCELDTANGVSATP